MKLKILHLLPPAWKSSSILPSLLDLLIDDPIFIPSHELAGCRGNPTPLQCHGVAHFSLFSKKHGISEPTIQVLLKSTDPKTLSQYLGVWKRFLNWINVSENACKINRSLICDFLLDTYTKRDASSTLNLMHSVLNFFFIAYQWFCYGYYYFSII